MSQFKKHVKKYAFLLFIFVLSLQAMEQEDVEYSTKATSEEPHIKQHVVIVGAGMAGLVAAHELKKQGISSEIYEGRDRIGGRTHTHYFNEEKTEFFDTGGTTLDDDHYRAIKKAKELV